MNPLPHNNHDSDDPDHEEELQITKLIRNGYLYSGYDYESSHFIFMVTEPNGSRTTAFLTRQGLTNEASLYAD